MCKVRVLPDEQQRGRSRTPRRRRRLRSSRGGRPQTATTEESSPDREDTEASIVSGVRLISEEVDSDLDAAPQGVVTPDISPVSTSHTDDLIILEEGQPPLQYLNARSNHEEVNETPHIVRDLSLFYNSEEQPATEV